MKKITAIFISLLISTSVFAGEVTDIIKANSNKINQGIAKSKDFKSFSDFMNTEVNAEEIINFEKMSQLTLGHLWRRATPEEKKEFVEEYKKFLYQFYVKSMYKFKDANIDYRREMLTGETGRLKTDVFYTSEDERRKAMIEYILYRENGKWKIVDVIIEGITLSMSYKDVFTKIINEKDFKGLIEELKRKNSM